MPKLITGISHALIYFNTLDGSKQTGISAMMKLCFGSDDDAISQVVYSTKQGAKTPVWVLPTRFTKDGSTIEFPVFTGMVGEEILAAVGRASDRFKQANVLGKLAGRAFRVTTHSVEEIKEEAAPAK
jgi:hypothetical protein